MRKYISFHKWAKAPLKPRVALAATLAEDLLSYHSDYFIKTYHQAAAMKMAWQCVMGKRISKSAYEIEKEKVFANDERADSEGYHLLQTGVPIALLLEMFNPDGKGILSALGGIECGYSSLILHKNGIDPCDRRMSKHVEEVGSFSDMVYDLVDEGYAFMASISRSSDLRKAFSWMKLPDPANPSFLSSSLQAIAAKPSRAEPSIAFQHEGRVAKKKRTRKHK